MITSFSSADVSDLSFVSVLDRVDSNWADWEVEFSYNGKQWSGVLGACPFDPEEMHGDEIIEAEEL